MESESSKNNQTQSNDALTTQVQANGDESKDVEMKDETFTIYVKTCGDKQNELKLQVNPADNVQDIRSHLLESIDTCYVTSYDLVLGDNKLNDYVDLSEVPDLKAESKISMREAPYDERSIRLHVRHLRDLMSFSEVQFIQTHSNSLYSTLIKDDLDGKTPIASDKPNENVKSAPATPSSSVSSSDSEVPLFAQNVSVADFYGPSQVKAAPISCVKSITYSGWNPPPGNRKLQGDLVYLDITTLENKSYSVTGWTKGFYVNHSTANSFEPHRSDKSAHSHSLVGLFNQISPLFKKNFQTVLSSVGMRHPFESIPVPFPVYPWIVSKEDHSNDINRAEDQLLFGSETEIRGQLRDWNEEYQTWKELPRSTIQEKILRDRALVKFNADFLEAATKGACAIIEKTVPPINPLDPEKAHMYIYNNIFFSSATDGRDIFKNLGGDRAAYISMNNDLKGVKAFNRADIKGLYTLATVIVDYRGHRLCAQSIIPGILQREHTATVIYGSIDAGKKISSDPAFHEVVAQAGKALRIKEHTVIDPEGNKHRLSSPVESKGIIGTDGRKYILDLVRVAPRDLNYTGTAQALTTLRPELILTYTDYLRQKRHSEKLEEEEKAKAENGEVNKDAAPGANGKPAESAVKSDDAKVDEKTEEEDLMEEEDIEFSVNPDVLCDYVFDQTEEETKADEALVREISTFLTDNIIALLLQEFSWFIQIPLDGESLSTMLHSHGINIRYLGLIAQRTDQEIVKELCIREMITRVCKHILRAMLRECEVYDIANICSHFLNCLIGQVSIQSDKGGKKNNKKPSQSTGASSCTTGGLWDDITREVKDRFKYDLPSRNSLLNLLKSTATYRSICLKCGIQIGARKYDLSTPYPFNTDDIVNLVPLTKHFNHESQDGQQLLAIGKAYHSKDRLDVAHQLLIECLAILHQVYGPLHKETAACYQNLALVLYQAKDVLQAIEYQHKAVIISERLSGLDSADTSQAYSGLAMFLHANGKYSTALSCIKRSLYLASLMTNATHPDIATAYTNIAAMLKDMEENQKSIAYLNEALISYESILGPGHIQTSAIYHSIALAYSNIGQYKDALAFEKKNYAILQSKVGDKDFRVVESNIWLRNFTQKAVQMQIETKKTQRDITSQMSQTKIKNLENGVSSKGHQTKVAPVPHKSGEAMGERSLNEILTYINGKPEGKSFMQRNTVSVGPSAVTSVISPPGAGSVKPPMDSPSLASNGKKKQKKKSKKVETLTQ